MKNIIVPISAFIFGFIFAVSLSPALAELIDSGVKIIDESEFSNKFATSSIAFSSEKEFELEKIKYNQNQDIIERLDKIIYLLRKQ